MENRRSFLKKGALAAAAAPLLAAGCKPSGQDKYGIDLDKSLESTLIVPKKNALPIRFFPIKFDKLRLKLEAAKRCGYDKAITFEFSHFMSPQSAYLQAGHLYDRYKEYFGL